MTYLGVSFIAALAASLTMFAETGSFLLAFVAYACTGSIVLLTVLAATAFNMRLGEDHVGEDGFFV